MPSKCVDGFAIYLEPKKPTSGRRFFTELFEALRNEAVPIDTCPRVILFNVSAPWQEILKSRLRRQKVVLRVDGLYFDRLSPAFVARFSLPLRWLLGLGLRFPRLHNQLAHLANFIDQNYAAFIKIFLAHHVIYQSKFCQSVYREYFPRKPYSIIVNGAKARMSQGLPVSDTRLDELKLATIYDEWRPSKRIYDIASFVRWLNEKKGVPAKLLVLGYTGVVPKQAPEDMKSLLENSEFISISPKFTSFDLSISEKLHGSHVFLSFCYRDACPNTVVEGLAHGLPVVGIASGGVPDIVGDAGALISSNDFLKGYFDAHRWEYDFPPVEYEQMYSVLDNVIRELETYRGRVQHRMSTALRIEVVAENYAFVLRNLN